MTGLKIVVPEELVGPRVLLDGVSHERFRRGRLEVSDLEPGPHTLAVGADGCEGKVLVIVLHQDETRTIEIFLAPKRDRIAPGGRQ